MKYAENILQTIGNTPLVKLNKLAKGIEAKILVKVEYLNPGGSIKDRIGVSMIEDAQKKGLLKKGATIIEPTSGNTGVGLAIVAAIKGYKLIFVMPDKMSVEKEWLLKAYGARVIRTPSNVTPDDPRSNIAVALRLVKEIPNSFCPMQYQNQANPGAHFKTTGPEIWKSTDGKITHLVAGMGTGGTITGTGRFLKKKNPKIKIIGVDPEGSLFHHKFYNKKGKIHQYKTEGIGEDFIPGTIDLSILDDILVISDKNSFKMTRNLVRKEGIFAGGSSGAAVFAALKLGRKLTEKDLVVVILPDSGRSYLSKIFNDDWMRENKFI